MQNSRMLQMCVKEGRWNYLIHSLCYFQLPPLFIITLCVAVSWLQNTVVWSRCYTKSICISFLENAAYTMNYRGRVMFLKILLLLNITLQGPCHDTILFLSKWFSDARACNNDILVFSLVRFFLNNANSSTYFLPESVFLNSSCRHLSSNNHTN